MKSVSIYIAVYFFALSFLVQSKEKILHIPYSNQDITVDGKLNDWTDYFEYSFSDTLYQIIPTPLYNLNEVYPQEFDFTEVLAPKSKNKVRFRAFWNNQNLYCAITVWDKHFFAQTKSRIDKPLLHLNDGVELYIDTGNEGKEKIDINDYQFVVDIMNETIVFKGDIREMLADTFAVPKDYGQNILFYSEVNRNGTVNDNIPDSAYTVEIVIPFSAIGVEPKTNMKMLLDICINDIDYSTEESNRYESLSTGAWPFDWCGYSDFGYPILWKHIQLSGEPDWYERLTEKYKSAWLWIYLFTVTLAILLISFFIIRTHKLRKLPLASSIEVNKIEIKQNEEYLSHNQKIIQNATKYITDNAIESINSEELAKELGISLRSFQRITRKEINLTPTNFICIIKLNLAAEFLKNNAGNISDATYEFGFSSPSYFSTQFKKHFEISPSEYIKNHSK
jgi:AraC-like DNA-binding protein